MTYAYGLRGAPAVGRGLPGLPARLALSETASGTASLPTGSEFAEGSRLREFQQREYERTKRRLELATRLNFPTTDYSREATQGSEDYPSLQPIDFSLKKTMFPASTGTNPIRSGPITSRDGNFALVNMYNDAGTSFNIGVVDINTGKYIKAVRTDTATASTDTRFYYVSQSASFDANNGIFVEVVHNNYQYGSGGVTAETETLSAVYYYRFTGTVAAPTWGTATTVYTGGSYPQINIGNIIYQSFRSRAWVHSLETDRTIVYGEHTSIKGGTPTFYAVSFTGAVANLGSSYSSPAEKRLPALNTIDAARLLTNEMGDIEVSDDLRVTALVVTHVASMPNKPGSITMTVNSIGEFAADSERIAGPLVIEGFQSLNSVTVVQMPGFWVVIPNPKATPTTAKNTVTMAPATLAYAVWPDLHIEPFQHSFDVGDSRLSGHALRCYNMVLGATSPGGSVYRAYSLDGLSGDRYVQSTTAPPSGTFRQLFTGAALERIKNRQYPRYMMTSGSSINFYGPRASFIPAALVTSTAAFTDFANGV